MLSRLPRRRRRRSRAEVATLRARLDEALAALVAERAEKERLLAHLEHSPKMPTPTLPPPGSPLVASASARSRRGASVDFSSSSPPLSRAAALAPGFPSPGFSSPGFSSPESTSFDRRFSANASGSSRSVEPTALAAARRTDARGRNRSAVSITFARQRRTRTRTRAMTNAAMRERRSRPRFLSGEGIPETMTPSRLGVCVCYLLLSRPENTCPPRTPLFLTTISSPSASRSLFTFVPSHTDET